MLVRIDGRLSGAGVRLDGERDGWRAVLSTEAERGHDTPAHAALHADEKLKSGTKVQ